MIVLVTLLTSSLSTGLAYSGGHVTAAAINSRLGLSAGNVTGVMVTAGTLSSTMMMAPFTTKLSTRNDVLIHLKCCRYSHFLPEIDLIESDIISHPV